MTEGIKSEIHNSFDSHAICITTEVQRASVMGLLNKSLMIEIQNKIADEIVKAFMEEHGAELLSSLKLADVKELALIKSANKLYKIFANAINK